MFTLWSTFEVKDPVHKNAHHDRSSLYAVRNFVRKLFDKVFVHKSFIYKFTISSSPITDFHITLL